MVKMKRFFMIALLFTAFMASASSVDALSRQDAENCLFNTWIDMGTGGTVKITANKYNHVNIQLVSYESVSEYMGDFYVKFINADGKGMTIYTIFKLDARKRNILMAYCNDDRFIPNGGRRGLMRF